MDNFKMVSNAMCETDKKIAIATCVFSWLSFATVAISLISAVLLHKTVTQPS